MPKLHRLAALAAVLLTLVFAAQAAAAPVTFNLRIEGATATYYEGPITTDGGTLTTPSGGTHKCDGTNEGANATPGGTPTTAAADAARGRSLAFDATWFAGGSDGDFFVTLIGSDDTPSDYSQTWSWWDDWKVGSVGGCQFEPGTGDDVLWSFGPYPPLALRLSAPARAATGESFVVSVGQTGGDGTFTPAGGAAVAGQTTDGSGHATISFSDPGQHDFKATRSDAIRSNAASVCVYTPGSGGCGTQPASSAPSSGDSSPSPTPPQAPAAVKDTTPPVVNVTSLVAGKVYDKGPRLLTGDANDAGGIAQVFLRLRAPSGGGMGSASRCRWFSGKRGVFTHRTVPCAHARFFRIGSDSKWSYLLPGRLTHGSYVLDVKVLDRAYNAGRASVPFAVR